MQSNNFNPKEYKGDNIQIRLEKGISRCLRWDGTISEYRTRYFEARKRGTLKKEDKKCFQDLKSAKNWLYCIQHPSIGNNPVDNSPKFKEIFENWSKLKLSNMRESSKIHYSGKFKYLVPLMDKSLNQIHSKLLDTWVEWLKQQPKKSIRCNYDKEIDLLNSIFGFHQEMTDEPYHNPIKKRHYKHGFVKEAPLKRKDMLEDEFILFRNELLKQPSGLLYATLATFQYYHCLRIGEAAGVSREDIKLGANPSDNSFLISKSVKWLRGKGLKPYIENNFKNSKYVNSKGSVLHPEAKSYFEDFLNTHKNNIIFSIGGELLHYRQVQYAYNKALASAKLPYTSTHVLRSGGASDYYNKHGNTSMTQSQLGVTSMHTASIYAKASNKPVNDLMISLYKK